MFSELDALHDQQNIKLNEESTLVTTFNTHKDGYKFHTMSFGLKMSQHIFQKKIDQTYEKYKGAVGIADEIQVLGYDNTHGLCLHEAVVTRKAGIELNHDQCTCRSRSCNFFGNIYTLECVNQIKVKWLPSKRWKLHPLSKSYTYK